MGSGPGSPYLRSVQVGATRKDHGVCTTAPLPTAQQTHGPVHVDPRPFWSTAVWNPGLNSVSCRTLTTHLTREQAQAFAREINTDTSIPVGAKFSCPEDDGACVDLYFAYPGRSDEMATIPLSGCRFVSAPGRGGRYPPTWTGGTTVLDAVTPQGWVRQNVGS